MNNPTYAAKRAGKKAIGSLPKTEKWVEHFARFGYATKGAVYLLIGILAAMAAFGAGGQTSGTTEIFQTILAQPFGQFLLALVALGFTGYAIWRFVQAIKDAEYRGSDTEGMLFRAGYIASGLLYGFFAFTAIKMIMGSSSGGGSEQTFVGKMLQQPAGEWLVGILAVAAIAKGLYQIYKGYTNEFVKDVRDGHVKKEIKDIYQTLGKIGYIARGIVFAIVGYFLLQAALSSNASQAGGTDSAFSFLSATGGPLLMGIIAIGLAGYGVFQIVKAKYKTFNT